jgi:hypothetical protein
MDDLDQMSAAFTSSTVPAKRKSQSKNDPKISAPKRQSKKTADPMVWNEYDETRYCPQVWPFTGSATSGLTAQEEFTTRSRPIDYFWKLFPLTLLTLIANETNRYALQKGVRSWIDTTDDEIGIYLAVIMLMSFYGKSCVKSYWSTDGLIETPIFAKLMTRDRFLQLKSCLHFADNLTSDSNTDRLSKVRPIYEAVSETFKNALIPFKNLCIDESLMLWKGRLGFKQYIPLKHARFGIKSFVLCDAETGFVLKLIVYTGSATELVTIPTLQGEKDWGLGARVVYSLLEDYLHKGHRLYVDNWYSSPNLFQKLHCDKTNACSTVRANRVNMPQLKKC